MDTCKWPMYDFDFLSDYRLTFPLVDGGLLFKGRVTQHSEFQHFMIRYFNRLVSILNFQDVKGSGAFRE